MAMRMSGARSRGAATIATVAVMVPLYWIFRELELVGTLPGLILAYTTFNLPFAIWILKGFFDNVPYAIEEAQMVDGATRFHCRPVQPYAHFG